MPRYPYRVLPLRSPDPSAPGQTAVWLPMLTVRLGYKHSRLTPQIEAIVDSGSPTCIFSADLCAYLGIALRKGEKGEIGGVVSGPRLALYHHQVHLWVAGERIEVTAGFAEGLAVGAILGRRGFFDNFMITFDSSSAPPGLDVQRIIRA